MGYLAARLGKDQPNKTEREQIILAIRDAILHRCSPARIFVFGSILGPSFTRASDVDCAVIFDSQTALKDARKQLYCTPSLVDLPYDLLLYEEAIFVQKAGVGGICQVIQETGRLIYDQKSKV